MESKKISNRAKQSLYATYKNKTEVDKALRLLKECVSLHHSTYKFLSYFSFRGTRGVTQAKIETICKAVGISLGTYARTVKRDLESFEVPLVIQIYSQKIGKDGRKNQGSTYKVLQPLEIIEQLIPKRNQEIIEQIKADMEKQFQDALERVTGGQ
jgi:hypothetical protein